MLQVRTWSLAVVVACGGITGCPRPVGIPQSGPGDAAVAPPVAIESVHRSTLRPALAGLDAGQPVADVDGSPVLTVFAGEEILIRGSGWETERDSVQVLVEGTPLALATASSPNELRAVVPEGMISGLLTVRVGTRVGTAHVRLVYGGPGHPHGQRSSGNIRTQIAIHAARANPYALERLGRTTTSTVGTEGQPGCLPSAAVSVAFNLGLSPDPRSPTFLATLDGFGQGVVEHATDTEESPRRPRRFESLVGMPERPFGVPQTGGLERLYNMDGGPDSFRLVGHLGVSDEEPGLRGPLWWTSGEERQWILFRQPVSTGIPLSGFAVVGMAGPVDGIYRPTTLWMEPGRTGVAAGWAQAAELAGWGVQANLGLMLVAVTCRASEQGGGLGLDVLELGATRATTRTLASLHEPEPSACAKQYCTAVSDASELGTLRTLEVWSSQALAILPSGGDQFASYGEAPCVVSLERTDAGAPQMRSAVVDVDIGPAGLVGDTPVLLAMESRATSTSNTDELLRVSNLGVPEEAVVQHVRVSSGYGDLVSGPRDCTAFLVPQVGDRLDEVDPSGAVVNIRSVLGTLRSAWPMEQSSLVGLVHSRALMVVDMSGYPATFVPTGVSGKGTVALEKDETGHVVGVWMGQDAAAADQGGTLVRWPIEGNTVGPSQVFRLPPTLATPTGSASLAEVRPALAARGVLVVVASQAEDADLPSADMVSYSHEANREAGTVFTLWLPITDQVQPFHLMDMAVPEAVDDEGTRLFLTVRPGGPRSRAETRVYDLKDRQLLEVPVVNGVTKPLPPFASLVALPTGAALGVVIDATFLTRWVACVTPAGMKVDMGRAVFNQGPMVLSPDGTRLYVGSENSVMELGLPPTTDTGCPAATGREEVSLAVLGRTQVEATPTGLAMDPTGQRVVWFNAVNNQMGVVE